MPAESPGSPKRPFRAAIFDLGNTLMEFETVPFAELNRRGAEHAFATLEASVPVAGSDPKELDRESFVRFFLAEFRDSVDRSKGDHREIPLAEIFPAVLRRLGISGSEELIDGLVQAHYQPIVAQVDLYPEVLEALAALKERGLKIGLISNTIWPEAFHRRDLDRYGILPYFDSLVFSSTLGFAKPSDRIFQASLSELGVEAAQAFYVGDRLDVDVGGARSSGLRAVLKTHPLRGRESVGSGTPDRVIDDLRELIDWAEV